MGVRTVDKDGKTTITESEMEFGVYPNTKFDELFDIEESKLYQAMRPHGVASAEFVLRQRGNNHIWIIEAKTSAPDGIKKDLKIKLEDFLKKEQTNDRDKLDFLNELYKKVKHDIYFDDLKSKFNDTLAIIAAISLKQHLDNAELPESFKFSQSTHINLVLVVKKSEWMDGFQDLVISKLKPLSKIWKLPPNSIKVLSEQRAIKDGLIIPQ